MTTVALHIQAQASTDQIRTQSFQDREYLVVPVVALVEGVLHSANSEHPELALASEFGRYPNAWDGRPVVMNHPKVNGDYVSANSPEVLEGWAFGQMFNTRLEGNKLKTEAWIDLAKVEALGGEVASTVERIQSGTMVEVSTGLFTSVEETSGFYAGQNYAGVWRSVAPDHLAFLSEGVLGACSVADGCGVPRLNTFRYINKPADDCGCGCGGTCSDGDQSMDTNDPRLNMFAQLGVNTVPDIEESVLEQVTARQNKLVSRLNMLLPNTLPADMPFENAQKLVRNKLEESVDLFSIYTMTSNVVVYERWDSYDLFQRSYTINEDGSEVILGDDEAKVNLLTKIVPVTNAGDASYDSDSEDADEEEDDKQMSANDAGETPTEGEDVMSDDTKGDVTNNQGVTPSTPATVPAPAVNETKTLSVQEYIAQAPADVQEMLTESLRLHSAKKDQLVNSLKSNERCDYTEDELKAMPITNLERLAKLANVPIYAAPSAPRAQSQTDANAVPKPLKAFPQPANTDAA